MTTPFQVSFDLLPSSGHKSTFSPEGVGAFLSDSFNADLLAKRLQFPILTRGRTLLLVADFGGHHQKQHFDTYTFLILDLAKNQNWLAHQRRFRHSILPNSRRMSFKALNDGMRRQALVPFMRAAAGIEGYLVQFAISKKGGSLFTGPAEDEVGAELLKGWKANVQERLLRVLHLSAFLLSGLSSPGQDVLWVIDEDAIAANVSLLTNLTRLFQRVMASYFSHSLGHIRCSTTGIADDGSLVLEDLASIADLTTGALGELCTGLVDEKVFPRQGLLTPLPKQLTWKTSLLASWMASPEFAIRRHTTILGLGAGEKNTLVSTLEWRMYERTFATSP
jgi:hypothetical protein